ncbi:MAG: hypothetical protein AABO41_16130 [Acidobacteriota bacterium]
MKIEQFVPSPRALLVTLASIVIVVLGVGAVRKSGKPPRSQTGTPRIESFTPRVQNKTKAFEVTQARQNLDTHSGPELSLRNGYDKAITAFAVSVNGLVGVVDFPYSENQDREIGPGRTYTRWFGSFRRSQDPGSVEGEEYEIKVLAVVFDDKTSEGEEKPIAGIFYERNRTKQLLSRIVAVLNEEVSLNTLDDNLFQALRSRVATLSRRPSDSMGINQVLRWLDQSEQITGPRKRILRVKDSCVDLIARL